MDRFLQDSEGSALVEFTVVFPLFMLVAFGTVDFTYMLFEWDMANKATYIGARTAVVSPPVASGITNLFLGNPGAGAVTYSATQIAQIGQPCLTAATGAPTNNCPAISNVVCTPAASGGSCTGGYAFDDTAFADTSLGTDGRPRGILPRMQAVFPRLQRQDVQISYQTNGLGFVGRPSNLGGLPVDVTVQIQCMTHQFYFLGALMGWAFPALPPACPAAPSGPTIPAFATTLPSEVLATGWN